MSQSLYNPRIAILASGSGSTAEAFIHATQDGEVTAEVGLVMCNNPPEKAGVFTRVAQLNAQYGLDIEAVEISGRTHPAGNVGSGQTLAESAAIAEKVREGGFAHVALMGYMRLVRGELIEAYGWQSEYDSVFQARMTNTHPGPLPETIGTFGVGSSARVLELGMSASRHTVHVVADEVDKGPIVAEHAVPVIDGDKPQDLFDRLQVVEKQKLPGAINNFLQQQREYFAE